MSARLILQRLPNYDQKRRYFQCGKQKHFALYQSTAASTWWCGPRPHLGWVETALGLPKGPSYPGHSPSFFRYAAPLTTEEGQHTASSKSVASLFFLSSPALLLPFFVSLFFSFS